MQMILPELADPFPIPLSETCYQVIIAGLNGKGPKPKVLLDKIVIKLGWKSERNLSLYKLGNWPGPESLNPEIGKVRFDSPE